MPKFLAGTAQLEDDPRRNTDTRGRDFSCTVSGSERILDKRVTRTVRGTYGHGNARIPSENAGQNSNLLHYGHGPGRRGEREHPRSQLRAHQWRAGSAVRLHRRFCKADGGKPQARRHCSSDLRLRAIEAAEREGSLSDLARPAFFGIEPGQQIKGHALDAESLRGVNGRHPSGGRDRIPGLHRAGVAFFNADRFCELAAEGFDDCGKGIHASHRYTR